MATKKADTSKSSSNGRSSPIPSDSDDSFGEIECDVCSKTFTSTQAYEQHINSKRHHKQLVKGKVLAKNKEIEKLLNPNVSDNEESEFAELHCKVCNMTFSGYKPYFAHTHGSAHDKNLKEQALKEKMKDMPGVNIEEDKYEADGFTPKPSARCTLCDKEFSGLVSFENHLGSKLHRKKLREQNISNSYKNVQDKSDEDLEEDFYKRCEVCDKAFSGLQPYNQHMKSSVHLKALKRVQAIEEIKGMYAEDSTDTKFVCKECDKPFTDPTAFKSHMENNSHEKNKIKNKMLELIKSYPEIIAGKTIKNEFSELDDNDDFQVGDLLLVCKMCHTAFSGPENTLDHLKSKKHLKVKAEKEKLKLMKKLKTKTSDQEENTTQDTGRSEVHQQSNPTSKDVSMQKVNGQPTDLDENDDFELI